MTRTINQLDIRKARKSGVPASKLTLDEVHEDVEGGHIVAVSLLVSLSVFGFLGSLTILGHLLPVR